MNEQEELQTRLKKPRREAKTIELAGLQEEMAGLQKELAGEARIAEKKIERAKVPISGGSSFRSISPVGTQDENLTKISGWIDKTEEGENLAQSFNVPSVYQQTSVKAPVITVRSMHGGQCSAQVRDLKPSVEPTISAEADKRGIGIDRTKTVIGAGSQIATAHPQVKFATSKPPMTLMADKSWVPPTNGGNPSSGLQEPQFTNRQKLLLPSQGTTFTFNARDDYFTKSSLPKVIP